MGETYGLFEAGEVDLLKIREVCLLKMGVIRIYFIQITIIVDVLLAI